MAKVAFTKLQLKEDKSVVQVPYKDQTIEVRQYLPIREKLEILQNIVNKSLGDEARYPNEVKIDFYYALEMIYHYTNISFTEKQKEDEPKLYDMLKANGLISLILDAIPEAKEMKFYVNTVIGKVYTYQNSAMGILENISSDYSNLNFDMSQLQAQISDPDTLKLLKSVGPMIGLN